MKTKPVPSSSVSNDDDGLNYKNNKKMKKKMKKTGASEDNNNKRKIVSVSSSDSSNKTSDKKRNKLKKDKQTPLLTDSSNQQLTTDNMDVAKSNKKVKKAASNKKRKGTELPEAETIEAIVSIIPDEVHESKSSDPKRDKKTSKSKKKKRDKESRKKDSARENVSHSDDADKQSGNLKSTSQIDNAATLFEDEDEVYEMSSGDEDETTGMKRWITKYHRARPGGEVLMENIDEFLVEYAAQKEREKKEREEEAAEGGWTVVTHQKGRKKTTEAESGTTVGSVAPAAVMDKLSKKKDKQVGLDFYRFQKREAQRNEIMTLQSKFEQDKKRIQELRAARKFRPY
ncbi:ribosomal RNA-processing protein 7 [Artemisia annua]|uniref:Ribosomal RNA-processing protein 7 n=1 Tax=Artemisia annua TaxID=35608 RepID=A0A2U1QER4_ARTAN|nr:ribosomal RNA-processing protein 7 [Artemisia annua]